MLDICGFPKEARAKVCHAIEQLWKRKQHRPIFIGSQGKASSASNIVAPSTSPSSSGAYFPNPPGAAKADTKQWATINKYLLKLSGVGQKSVDLLGQFLKLRGTANSVIPLLRHSRTFYLASNFNLCAGDIPAMLQHLDKLIKGHKQGQEGLDELRKLIKYLQIFNILDRVHLDIGTAVFEISKSH